MKVYSEFIIDLETGAVLEETVHNPGYQGPIALCDGGGSEGAGGMGAEDDTDNPLDYDFEEHGHHKVYHTETDNPLIQKKKRGKGKARAAVAGGKCETQPRP